MKLPLEKNNKSELCIKTIKCNDCCDLKAKFSIRNINFLFSALYMIIFITSYYMINYVHYVVEQKSNDIQSNCKRIIDKEIITNRIMIHKNNQNGKLQTKLPSEFFNHNNNQQQNVQNERKMNAKIHDSIANNNYINFHSANEYPQKRLKRDADNLFKDNDLFSSYEIDNQNDEPIVEAEFFDPKYRGELESRDAEIVRKTGKGPASGDEWVWLTQYCRIPYEAVTGYCKEARMYCPPAPQGLQGVQGPRGEVGLPGPPGREGKPGIRGPKGEIGFPGNPGLDGRDGINGEPGLDGIPGRAGADGADGINGKDGKDGMPGMDGKNGAQGSPGLPGPLGVKGMKGERGLRGKTGKPGKDGVPGINVWKAKVNGTFTDELLVPPSIATADYNTNKPRSIIVREGDHLRLRCAANGNPPPNVEWMREDERAISFGAWELSSVSGQTLNITKVNRVHMGLYKCIADNGIPPTANQTYQVEVFFAPLIQINSQNVYVENDSTVTLECEVEAFPDPIRFWEKMPENKLLEQNDGKYYIETVHTDRYKSIMRLNITKIRSHDYGEYRCVSKNEMGIARAVFHVQERNPYNIPSVPNDDNPIMFGARPPLKESLEDLCPPQICPDCSDVKETKCRDTSVSLNDLFSGNLELKPSGNKTYMGLPSRTLECVLYAVGKPVYIKYTEQNYGSWLKDSAAKNDIQAEKIWSTRENDDFQLFEYANKVEAYRNNVPSKVYQLQFPFKGNAHVVYNGYFYYFRRDEPKIVKYDLTMDKQAGMKELDFVTTNNTNYLYTTDYNLVDFNVDENGLWVIYSTADSNNTIVSMLNPITLEALYSLNISINHHKMFITCGVLYAIDSATDKNTKIRFALDLYTLKLLDVSLSFTNPFKKTTTLGYNHKNKELYALDKGNQLLYPIRYHEINHTGSRNDDSINIHQHANYDMNPYSRGNLN